ncbi:hypothetical protein LB559_05790 [Mesorhizobium sp. BR1-1-3]|uniref:hypothetical protein n=1 Tax=Mesorhizobium sp. BR1-1-3 TaxID=2876651 RepID=UPI001CD0E3CB|nr:hypothetical protein [Mesorhizobium sp. BR1-1-3]MBZ9887452.1 hypothetical protein [Mesorhizobium sp. BR1-1-3]
MAEVAIACSLAVIACFCAMCIIAFFMLAKSATHPSYLEQKDDAARRLAEPLGPTVREAVATAMAKARRSETY